MPRSGAAALRLFVFGVLVAATTGASAFSGPARALSAWVQRSQDNAGMPFVIVDKRNAELHVFDAGGRLVASTPALLGVEAGDDIAAGVGERAQRGALRAGDRTTPAGRFVSESGVNHAGEHVIWVDYDSAFAIHRVRPGNNFKFRMDRLAAGRPRESRVSNGCVVVAADFYTGVLVPSLGTRSVVYVLPEARDVRTVFRNL